MKNFLYIPVFFTAIVALSLSGADKTFAQCVVTGATPGGGEIVQCMDDDPDGITTTDSPDEVTVFPDATITRNVSSTISTLNGDDRVEIFGGTLSNTAAFDCVRASNGNDVIIMHDGLCTAGGDCLDGGDGDDVITMNGGMLDCGDEGFDAGNGNDVLTITGGRIEGSQGIRAGNGNDEIFVTNAVIDRTSNDPNDDCLDGNIDNDIIRLGTGVECTNGQINGASGFDTLVFEMEVPAGIINSICGQILTQDPGEGSITINGLFYDWENFELLVCDLQPLLILRPIPTLSQWGLIATAGVLGMVGLFAIRRRKAAA